MDRSTKQHQPLETRVLDFIRRNNLLVKANRVVVAVSGGPDSVCLLHILLNLKDTLGITLHIAHLNHKLRADSAQADAEYVAGLARQLGIPSTIEEFDVIAYRSKHSMSLEEAAREVRYGFFMDVVRLVGAAAVTVGHTRDDNIETVLLHLIRGTGTRGLRGLQPRSKWIHSGKATNNLIVIRPLLNVARQETIEYCREHRITPRIDETNFSLSLLRNRVRLELLPTLRSYNPRVDDALLRMAQITGDELAFLNEKATRIWGTLAEERNGSIILNRQKLLRQPPAVKRHILRMAMEAALGNLKDIEALHIEEMLAVLPKSSGTTVSLPGGLVFAVEYDRYLLTRDLTSICPFPVLEGEFTFKVPGETLASGWRVTAAVSSHTGETPAGNVQDCHLPQTLHSAQGDIVMPSGITSAGTLSRSPDIHFSACFDLDLVGRELAIRSCQSGDRFRPLGLGHSKKVGQFMVDARIPRWWRGRVPIVASPKQIIWLVGWRIDETVKVTPYTKKVLCLEFTRAPDTGV